LQPEPNFGVSIIQWLLGAILLVGGDPEGNAESLIHESLDGTIVVLGEDSAGPPKHRLAMLLAKQGRTEDAARLYYDIVGRGGSDYMEGLMELARAHEQWLPDAEDALRRAIDKHEPVLGPTHAVVADLQKQLETVVAERARLAPTE